MKKMLTLAAFLIAAEITAQNTHEVSIQFGLANPQEPFSETTGIYAGGAQDGFTFGAEYNIHYESNFGIGLKGGFTHNKVDYEQFSEEMSRTVDGDNHNYGYLFPGALYRISVGPVFMDIKVNLGVVYAVIPEVRVSGRQVSADGDFTFGTNPGAAIGFQNKNFKIFLKTGYTSFTGNFVVSSDAPDALPQNVEQKYRNMEWLIGMAIHLPDPQAN